MGDLQPGRGKRDHSIFVPARPGLGRDLLLDTHGSRCFVRSSATKGAGSARGLPRRGRLGRSSLALQPAWAYHGVHAIIAAQLSHAHLFSERASRACVLPAWSVRGARGAGVEFRVPLKNL